MDIIDMSTAELLVLHSQIGEELRTRGIARTSNNPTGDLAEYLFCKTFRWSQENNSNANIDAIDTQGIRYQIKGRRITRYNNSRQLSAIRDLAAANFDYLAAVLFSEDYSVVRAAIVPRLIVEQRSVFVSRTNSHKFFLRDDVWNAPGVHDVTIQLRATEI